MYIENQTSDLPIVNNISRSLFL